MSQTCSKRCYLCVQFSILFGSYRESLKDLSVEKKKKKKRRKKCFYAMGSAFSYIMGFITFLYYIIVCCYIVGVHCFYINTNIS